MITSSGSWGCSYEWYLNKFIDMLYCNKFKNYTLKSNLEKVDYVFTQSEYTSKYLKNKKIINKKLISTGFLYYDYWYETKKNSVIVIEIMC